MFALFAWPWCPWIIFEPMLFSRRDSFSICTRNRSAQQKQQQLATVYRQGSNSSSSSGGGGSGSRNIWHDSSRWADNGRQNIQHYYTASSPPTDQVWPDLTLDIIHIIVCGNTKKQEMKSVGRLLPYLGTGEGSVAGEDGTALWVFHCVDCLR